MWRMVPTAGLEAQLLFHCRPASAAGIHLEEVMRKGPTRGFDVGKRAEYNLEMTSQFQTNARALFKAALSCTWGFDIQVTS